MTDSIDHGFQSEIGGAVANALARHQDELLRYPNVVGVAAGLRTVAGKQSSEECIVVYVTEKVATKDLGSDEVLPEQVDGVGVDVVAVGEIKPLPT